MLLLIGYFVVTVSVLGGFVIAGGHPMLLVHVSEFVVIGGMALGVLIIASPMSVMKKIMADVMTVLKGKSGSSEDIMDLMKVLYELFMVGRRNGLIALDEHITNPQESNLLNKYPSLVGNKSRIEFLCNALRPIIDGKIKPEQLQQLLEAEIHTMEEEAHSPIDVLNLVGDSLPGIGIVAAVLGIINTMAAIADGPEKVGQKVAAALTGTFLGILGAYGFINPLTKRISFNNKAEFAYYTTMSKAISGFAKGLAPIMAVEIARRSLEKSMQPGASELEETLKALNSAG